MSFVFIKVSDKSTRTPLLRKFDGFEEVIDTKNGGRIVVARSLKDPRGWSDWSGHKEIEVFLDDGIPEDALMKYGSAETRLKLQKKRRQEAGAVEVPNPCPFCGGAASVDESCDYLPGWISCENKTCRIQPFLSGRNCEEDFTDLIIIWNNRPN